MNESAPPAVPASPPPPPPPPKLYATGEVLRHAGVSRQMLHVYTTLGLVTPQEFSPTGRRWYGEEVFARLRRIAELKQTMTLEQILAAFKAEEARGAGDGTPEEPRGAGEGSGGA